MDYKTVSYGLVLTFHETATHNTHDNLEKSEQVDYYERVTVE